MPPTTSDYDLELTAADGVTPIGLMLARPRDATGAVVEGAPLTLAEALSATDADAPISSDLTPLIQEGWSRGVGLDYDMAPGVDTLDPDYACPAGAATDVPLPSGSNIRGTIIAIEEYGTSLFVAQIGTAVASGGGRISELAGGVAPATTSLTVPDGEYIRGLVRADDGSGNIKLYAMVSDGGTQNGRIYRFDGGTTWTATAAAHFGTNGRGQARTVFWRGRDGIGATRIVCISGPRTVSYTKPNADPMLNTSWVESVKIGTSYVLKDIAVSRGHAYFGATDNLFDLDEVGNSPGLTSYINQQVQPGNGDAVQYHDGSVYYSFGRGLLKINVEQQGVLSEQPGQCAPGAFLPVEKCLRGYVSAMTTDQGWLVASVFDTTTRQCGIFYGKSRESLNVDSPNPMIWHGPLFWYLTDYGVQKMRTSALAGDARLWVATISDATGFPQLTWFSRPLAGSAMQDLQVGGPYRVTTGAAGGIVQPYARLYGLKQTWGDKASRKDLHQIVVGSRGLDSGTGTKLTYYVQADPAPGFTTWGTGVNVTAGPTQAITPSETTSGYSLVDRIDFFAPQGGAALPANVKIPFLDSIRKTAWLIAPATGVRTLAVEYGDDVLTLSNGHDDSIDPDTITASLEALCGVRTVLRDRQDKRWNVRVRQVLERVETLSDSSPYGKQVVAKLQVQVLGGPL